MNTKALSQTLLAAIVTGLFAVSASAQWLWIDKNGHKIFSDRSPPSDIQDKDILTRPPGAARAAAPKPAGADATANPAVAASAAVAKGSAPKLSGKDKELEAKKKQAETEEAAKKKAEEDKVAQAKADSCNRAKQNMSTLQSGVRISTVNAKGEKEIFDDAKRASETKRTQEIIDASCK